MPGVVANGVYYNTDSGLSAPGGFLDRLTGTVDQTAQSNALLRGYAPGLAATGIPVPAPPTGILASIASMTGLAPPAGASASPPTTPQQPGMLAQMFGSGAGPAPATAPAQPPSGGPGGLMTLVGQTAQKYGIDPGTALKVAMAEGGASGGYGPNGIGDKGTSFSPFQLHYGGGMGDDFTAATGLDASDPKNVAAAVDYSLMRASKEGWGAFHGAKRAGIGQFDGIGQPPAGQAPPSAIAYAGPQGAGAPASPAAAAIGAASPAGGAQQPPMPLATAETHVGPSPQPPADGSAASPPQQPSVDQVRAMVASNDPATRAQGMRAWQALQQNLPPVGAAPSPGSPSPTAPQPTSFGPSGAASQPAGAPSAPASGSTLPGMPPGLTPAALGAMIAEPATRAQGLALWQSALSPPAPTFGKPGEMAFVRGRPTYQIPFAPADVAPGHGLLNQQTGAVIGSVAPAPVKLGPAETLVPADGGAPIAGNASGTLDTATIESLARRVYSGDSSALTGISRGPLGAQNVAAIQARAAQLAQQYAGQPKPSFPESDILANAADQAGAVAGARTSGEITAKLDTFANEASNAMDLGIQASRQVPRTTWTPLNAALQKIQAGSGDPKLAQFTAASNAIVNTYAKAINPSGVPTDSDKAHARDVLSTAQSPEAFEATVQQLQREVNIAHNAARGARAAERAGTAAAPISDAPKAAAPGSTSVGLFGQGGSPAGGTALPVAAPAIGAGDPRATAITAARAAISAGAPRAAVLQRLQGAGIDPTGL